MSCFRRPYFQSTSRKRSCFHNNTTTHSNIMTCCATQMLVLVVCVVCKRMCLWVACVFRVSVCSGCVLVCVKDACCVCAVWCVVCMLSLKRLHAVAEKTRQNTLPAPPLPPPPLHHRHATPPTRNVTANRSGAKAHSKTKHKERRTDEVICIATANSETRDRQLDPMKKNAPTRKIDSCTTKEQNGVEDRETVPSVKSVRNQRIMILELHSTRSQARDLHVESLF